MALNQPIASRKRWWDIPAALLLFAGIATATIRLAATNWTDELSIVQFIAGFGLIAGLALGQSIFSRFLVTLFGLIYGIFVISWQLGDSLYANIMWSERMISLAGRLGVTLTQLIQRKPVNDSILFLFIMALLFWVLSLHAGYILTRYGHPWQATLPMGLTLFIIHIHDPYWPYRTWFLATYIFFALLLLARLTYMHNRVAWEQRHTRLPPYLGLDLIRVTLTATAVLIVLAWTAPAMASSVPLAERAWKEVSRPWTIARSRMSNAFASLRASVGLVYDYYGDVLPLGRGNLLTDDIVLTIKAPASSPDSVQRFYWRARVYDQYEDGLWTGNYNDSQSLTPENFELPFQNLEGRWASTFEVTPWVPLSTLFVVPQPEWVSRPVRADLIENGDGTIDLGALHADINVQPGEQYQVRSSISSVTESELRAAGTEYPEWITERYLQLPDTTTERTINLANRIARPFDNPYDVAVAVTNYLRNNITYANTVPVPPTDQDPVDWVLFDLQEGFCNYYATSEIVLLRSVGIPARWAVGYAQGEFDSESNSYEVRQRDAHSWPEVYFPGVGWVEFEPTLSQPTIDRPLGNLVEEEEFNPGVSQLNPDGSPGFPGEDGSLRGEELAREIDLADQLPVETNPVFSYLLFGTALALIGISLFAWRQRGKHTRRPLPVVIELNLKRIGLKPPAFLVRWARAAALSPLSRAYIEINRALVRLGQPPEPFFTPAERGAALVALLPNAALDVDRLLAQYQQVTYSQYPGDLITAQSAAKSVRNMSWLARLNRLLSRFQDPRQESPDRQYRFLVRDHLSKEFGVSILFSRTPFPFKYG